jgi:hypothetical protein
MEGHLEDFSFQNVAGSSDQQSVQDRIYNYINCWNLSAVECIAMWHPYQKEGRGVTIESSWSDLIGSITSPFEIHGAMIDYDATRIPFQDVA